MDSHIDLQNPVQSPRKEQTQPISPPDGPSGTQRSPPASDTNDDISAGALRNQPNVDLRALGKTFGHIPGVPIFTEWGSRKDCCNSAVHRAVRAGICGNSKDGAFSVVLSNGYEDDQDEGDVIIYTGAGGKKQQTETHHKKRLRFGPQTLDQSWDWFRNKALVVSFHTGEPVRVVRSWKCRSKYAPLEGYRYDGLYKVTKYWTDKGRKGKDVCRCRLERLPHQPPIPQRST